MSGYQPRVFRRQGGNELVVASGGVVDIQEGAVVRMADGYSADGLGMTRVARATYDFAEHGGVIGPIGSGVTLPDNAIILRGMVDVATTCQTAGGDAGTMAIHVQGAGDIVAAIAVNNANPGPWDAGLHDVIPVGTAATAIKLTAPREITFTIAGQAFTAGKFTVWLEYVLGD
jgi:hypothetical protein